MKIDFKIDGLQELRAAMADFSQRRMNAALATALTRTAVDVKRAVQTRMPQVLDRPTPYAINSLFVKPATASRLEAITYFKDDRATSQSGIPATYFLLPNVEGGGRRTKRFERVLQMAGHLPDGWFVVPGAGAQLDAYGNISRGQIVQVLSQLRITPTAGYTRNMSFDARKQLAAQRKAGGRFFVIPPGKRAAPGVYQREFAGRNVTPVWIFVRRAKYSKRFDFYEVAQREAAAKLGPNAEVAMREQLERLQASRGAK